MTNPEHVAPLAASTRPGLHVAVIMDGSGRWATRRGLPRSEGHRSGAEAVRRTVTRAVSSGVSHLTLFAFSSDNWQRPEPEVAALMTLFGEFLRTQLAACLEHDIRLSVIGRRDRLRGELSTLIERAESATLEGRALHLRLAIDYSSREAILRAARELGAQNEIPGAGSGQRLADVPDVDLLIRTGGERRLSDFLLWECAYAELVFLDRMWPDFDARDLDLALAEYARRERRFGLVTDTLALI